MAKAAKVWTLIYAERQPIKKDGTPSNRVKYEPVDKRCPSYGFYYRKDDERLKGKSQKELENLEINFPDASIVFSE